MLILITPNNGILSLSRSCECGRHMDPENKYTFDLYILIMDCPFLTIQV